MHLQGVRVVDLTRILSGPFCTLLLADMGAEVIKVEPPGGDPLRAQGVIVEGLSWYFAACNRNKRSVVVSSDLCRFGHAALSSPGSMGAWLPSEKVACRLTAGCSAGSGQ